MKRCELVRWVALVLGFGCVGFASEPSLVLTNQVGYEVQGPKRAVLRALPGETWRRFEVRRHPDGGVVLEKPIPAPAAVDHWPRWHYASLDFDELQAEGRYTIRCRGEGAELQSSPFLIEQNALEHQTLGDVVVYFKGQRCTGALDWADRKIPFLDSELPPIDAHGGWMDAAGDYGKHLSHLAYSTYHNPQQIPLVVYSLFKALDRLGSDANFAQDRRRILDEAWHGAEYLVRVAAPNGSFFETVANRGPEKRAEDRRITPVRRTRTASAGSPGASDVATKALSAAPVDESRKFQVSFRGGGGMAIAALAMAARHPYVGAFSAADCRAVAERTFAFLETHNLELTNDGRENIVDDYCALTAATELLRTTQAEVYARAAARRADNLMRRLIVTDAPANHFRADDGTRPFFHAADAGLPVVALLYYREVAEAEMQARIGAVVRRALEGELRLTNEVANPFGLGRQYVQGKAGERRTSFFYPHDSDSAPWWQGENARLASLAAATRLALPLFADDSDFRAALERYAANQLNWILGMNPFDACMLDGHGRSNPDYIFKGTYQYRNLPGGICNGITAAVDDPRGIAFDWTANPKGEDTEWRWGEQWLPHAAWYLLAVAARQPPDASRTNP